MRHSFSAGSCLDLGAFDPSLDDCGVGAFLARAQNTLDWVVLMEDRQPVFFHGYAGYEPGAPVPLNRHGPGAHAWRQQDVKRLVEAFHASDVKVLFGYWVHECSFVDERHPELLIRDATGELWQDRTEMNADFSPLRRLREDAHHGIRGGERYADWSARRYADLARDFGFDGLFLGDGAMGFRRHGEDWKDLRHFDFHEDWLAEFRMDHAFSHHDGCAIGAGATTAECAADVQAHHWAHWVEFNTERWTEYYRTMAKAVHDTGGILAAYNCMNYDPMLARQHGVDYRGIAKAGLDILIFQAYDYAWGPLGPFGSLNIVRKDLETNLQALLRVRAHVGHDTSMQVLVTVETEDEVETWNAPVAHTLGELYHYGNALSHDGTDWRRATDGAFVVWGNSVAEEEWRGLSAAFAALSNRPHAPHASLEWDEAEITSALPVSKDTHAIYAHLATTLGVAAITRAGPRAARPVPRERAKAP